MRYSNIIIHSDDFNTEKSTSAWMEEVIKHVKDTSYLEFVERINGGFFYNYSLQLYSLSTKFDFHNIFTVNDLTKETFEGIVDGEFFFGQEAFGNQFGYSKDGIILFNIESGYKELIASNFDDWLSVLDAEVDYFTGRSLVERWNNNQDKLTPNTRLVPKIPFSIGGEYEIKNLYLQPYPNYFTTNSNIARQLYNLPDGAKVKLRIEE